MGGGGWGGGSRFAASVVLTTSLDQDPMNTFTCSQMNPRLVQVLLSSFK